jgi:hypothetical protein
MEHNSSLCSLQGGESVSSQSLEGAFHHRGVGVCQRICDNCWFFSVAVACSKWCRDFWACELLC